MSNRVSQFVLVFTILITALGLPIPSAAVQTNKVLAYLRRNDNQVQQGSIIYDCTQHNFQILVNVAPPPSIPYRKYLTWSKHGRYKDITQDSKGVIVHIGGVHQNLYAVSNSVEVEPPPQSFAKQQQMLGSLEPGPCAGLGRGLSSLQGLSITQNGQQVDVAGRTSNDNTVRAVLDPAHEYVARDVSCYAPRGGMMLHWRLWKWIKSKDGVWIPEYAREDLYVHLNTGKNALSYRITYHIIKADFQAPPSSAFEIPLKGKTVTDDRFGMPVAGSQTYPGESLNQILHNTGSVAHQILQMDAAAAKAKQHRPLIQALLTSLFIFTIIAFVWVLWKKRTHSA
ncbi:MAG: hypothetical protein M1330_01885 [Armatimonadetes bacterium]|nr:hypothetical protein [Armatimonadota bacterium]